MSLSNLVPFLPSSHFAHSTWLPEYLRQRMHVAHGCQSGRSEHHRHHGQGACFLPQHYFPARVYSRASFERNLYQLLTTWKNDTNILQLNIFILPSWVMPFSVLRDCHPQHKCPNRSWNAWLEIQWWFGWQLLLSPWAWLQYRRWS